MEARARLSERERRLLALAGLGLAVGLYASLAAVPLLQRYLTAAAAVKAAHALRPVPALGGASLAGQREAVGGEAARLRARLAELEAAVPRRLDGASLLEEMERLAAGAGVRVRHVDLGAPARVGGEVRQRVEVELSGTTAAHLGFLAALDGEPWLMRVEACTLEAVAAAGAAEATAATDATGAAGATRAAGAAEGGRGAEGAASKGTAEPVRMTCQLAFFLAANG